MTGKVDSLAGSYWPVKEDSFAGSYLPGKKDSQVAPSWQGGIGRKLPVQKGEILSSQLPAWQGLLSGKWLPTFQTKTNLKIHHPNLSFPTQINFL
jgi:hypothetical protein